MNNLELNSISKKSNSEWIELQLGEICNELYRYPTYFNINYVEKGIPEIRGELITKSGYINKETKNYRYISKETSEKFKRTILKKGDFVLSVRGTIGKVAMIDESLEGANITANLMRISPDSSKVFSDFLRHCLLSVDFQKTINNLSPQTTIKTIQAPLLKSVKILIPPLPEQQKIASILSNVNNLIQKTNQVIEQTQRLKKGLMQRILTKGIGHSKFKKTEMGEIPEGWDTSKLGDIIDEIRYGSSIKCTNEPLGIPVLRIPNVVSEKLNLDELKYASFDKDELDRVTLKDGDILFVRTNGNKENVGKTIVFPEINEKYAFASYLIKVTIRKTVAIPQFLVYQLKTSKLKKQILNSIRTSAGQYNLNTEGIKSLKIVLPNLDEQQKVISILSNMDIMIQKLQDKKKSEEKLKKGLMQQLLTGNIRVKV